MLKAFREYITQQHFFDQDSRILLTVSGGIDSVVMLDLFNKAGFETGIAHCNFQLRGAESDGDEQLVRELAADYQVPVYVKRFETLEYASAYHLSTQMAARELRYQWFDEVASEEDYTHIATAHNQNDNVETFFINLFRGTGIRGLSGISPVNGKLVRPMLFATRETIADYCRQQHIIYREDSSNLKTDYLRNKIRHVLRPVVDEISPGFWKTASATLDRLAETDILFSERIEQLSKEIVHFSEGKVYIDIEKLKETNAINTCLFEFINEFGFSSLKIRDIAESLDGPSGRTFLSTTHELVKDRQFLIIRVIPVPEKQRFYIEADQQFTDEPIPMELEIIQKDESFILEKDREIALLDYDLIDFPLLLRKWQAGDYFKPLGMRGLKKLSDYFVDNKFSLVDKQETWILASGDKIVWIVGHRLDDRFKVTDETRNVLRISLKY